MLNQSLFLFQIDRWYDCDPKICVAKELKIQSMRYTWWEVVGHCSSALEDDLLPAAAAAASWPPPTGSLLHCTLTQPGSRRRGRLEAKSARDQASGESRLFGGKSAHMTWADPWTLQCCCAAMRGWRHCALVPLLGENQNWIPQQM